MELISTLPARKNANDNYQQATGTDHYYKYSFGHTLTDGSHQLAIDYGCYWFLDVIASYQMYSQMKREGFQVWKLQRIKEDEFKVTCEDGNKNVLRTQVIPFSDFKDDECTMWLIDKVIMLPSEY